MPALSRFHIKISQLQVCVDVLGQSNAVGVAIGKEEVAGVIFAVAPADLIFVVVGVGREECPAHLYGRALHQKVVLPVSIWLAIVAAEEAIVVNIQPDRLRVPVEV